jgi:hypothetical protein
MAWSHITINFIEALPRSQGNVVILVAVDKFTKYAHFISLSHPLFQAVSLVVYPPGKTTLRFECLQPLDTTV